MCALPSIGSSQTVSTRHRGVCAHGAHCAPVDPVFFASQCGRPSAHPPSATALPTADARDYRVSSLNAAVEVCRTNNVLGLLLDADFLVRVLHVDILVCGADSGPIQHAVPSLIQAVKDCGLLLGAFSTASHLSMLESSGVDAILHEGIMTYSTRHY